MLNKNPLKKYFKPAVMTEANPYPQVSAPRLMIKNDIGSGLNHFTMTCWPVSKPFEMVSYPHKHEFDQMMIFSGGDLTKIDKLGGEVDITLSEDGKTHHTFTLTEATQVYLPAGLYHCPLVFRKIDDETKPIFFQYLFFEPAYGIN